MITNPQHALVFGSLNLIGTNAELAANGYRFEALADTTDFSNPVPIDQQVDSWLQDGSIISSLKSDNRPDMVIRVRVVGTNSNYLALAEQALVFETGKTNTLTWTPPDGAGAPCVFDVVMSHLEHDMDDMGELQKRPERVYRLVIQALPFVRSQTLVSVTKAAPTGTQTITSIDACTSATNWLQAVQVGAGTPTTSAPSVVGGTAVLGTTSSLSTTQVTQLSLTRSSLSVSMSTTPYLRVDLTPVPVLGSATWANGTSDVSFKVNGTSIPVAQQAGSIYWFDVSAIGVTTLTSFAVSGVFIAYNSTSFVNIAVADLSRSNVLGDQGTGRQLLRSLPVAGSARTQGNLAVSDATASLGQVLVYTYPQTAGVTTPSLRQWRSIGGGTVTTDATTVFGSTMDITTAMGMKIPANQIQPGGHVLLARLKHGSVGARTMQWSLSAYVGAGSPSAGLSGTAAFTSTGGTWDIVPIASLSLPLVKVGSLGQIYLTMQGSSGLLLDDAWLFNVETGRLTWVECGTASPTQGGEANRLWLDAPSVASPVPAVYVGTASDRSDSYAPSYTSGHFAAMYSLGNHEFVPPAMNVFTVTTNSTASSITLSHFPRFHTHVAS